MRPFVELSFSLSLSQSAAPLSFARKAPAKPGPPQKNTSAERFCMFPLKLLLHNFPSGYLVSCETCSQMVWSYFTQMVLCDGLADRYIMCVFGFNFDCSDIIFHQSSIMHATGSVTLDKTLFTYLQILQITCVCFVLKNPNWIVMN